MQSRLQSLSSNPEKKAPLHNSNSICAWFWRIKCNNRKCWKANPTTSISDTPITSETTWTVGRARNLQSFKCALKSLDFLCHDMLAAVALEVSRISNNYISMLNRFECSSCFNGFSISWERVKRRRDEALVLVFPNFSRFAYDLLQKNFSVCLSTDPLRVITTRFYFFTSQCPALVLMEHQLWWVPRQTEINISLEYQGSMVH